MANNVRKETRVTSRDSLLSPKYTIDVGLRGISTRTNTNEILQGHSGAGAAGSAGLRRTTVGSRPSKSRCLRWLTVGCRRRGFLSLTGPPKLPGAPDQQPSTWRGRSEQILLKQVGCESRKIPAPGQVFFLDFPIYRTNQALLPSCGDSGIALWRQDSINSEWLHWEKVLPPSCSSVGRKVCRVELP